VLHDPDRAAGGLTRARSRPSPDLGSGRAAAWWVRERTLSLGGCRVDPAESASTGRPEPKAKVGQWALMPPFVKQREYGHLHHFLEGNFLPCGSGGARTGAVGGWIAGVVVAPVGGPRTGRGGRRPHQGSQGGSDPAVPARSGEYPVRGRGPALRGRGRWRRRRGPTPGGRRRRGRRTASGGCPGTAGALRCAERGTALRAARP